MNKINITITKEELKQLIEDAVFKEDDVLNQI